MYHYVREFDRTHPYFRYLDVANFRKQLDYFDRVYGFVTREEWRHFISNGKLPAKSGKVVLTFDDAMRCHFDFVYPELKSRGLWGIFYIPTGPYCDGRLLDVHRIHLLSGAFIGTDLFHEAMRRVSEGMVPDAKRQEFRERTYATQSNLPGVAEFKRLFNYFIDYQHRRLLLDELATQFRYTFDPASFYVSREQLKRMWSDGMIIGSHTINHPVMSKLSRDQQRLEISGSFSYLEELGVLDQRTYCHPYGGFHSFNSETVSLLEAEGVAYSFNVEPREIATGDYEVSKQFLPRFDCNLFAHGCASLP